MSAATDTREPQLGWNARRRWIAAPVPAAETVRELRARLLGPLDRWRDWPRVERTLYWAIPLASALIAGILRFTDLQRPHSLIFDETYYVKDAYSYLQSGYERNWGDSANEKFLVGDFSGLQSTPEYVVHPPVGKWMIAFGMWLFGPSSSFGWRFSAALVGTLSVALLAWAAYKLFRSAVLAGTAGLLLAVDGHHLTMSRIGILDIFLSFWLLAAFCALLKDRDDGRRRLAARLGRLARPDGRLPATALAAGPWLGVRWWRIAAGVCLGLAVGVKWSALAFVAAFGLMTVLWDASARRRAGIRAWLPAAVVRDAPLAAVSIVVVGGLVYLSTWTGWFLSADGYFRHWAETHPDPLWSWIPASLRSLAHYHLEAYSFHTGLSASHPYASSPWSWLVQGRPTSFYYVEPSDGCTAGHCSSAILSVGNPLIWWAATAALAVGVLMWAGRRDWRIGAALCGVAAGYLPWFMYPERTMFAFYEVSFEPFLILVLAYVLGLVLGRPADPPWRRQAGLLGIGVYLVLVLVVSAYFMPIWTAQTIPYGEWRLHMWMPSWV
ncbi:phospholipid carrier-dependent glycosyltransferase [Sinomonas sp. JGH33]|uniref:Polyprenol-phosphate-mannose--protein mannosyltransferase n=1 Tax=Sinomonas terricola TaxID=3110330 RepID=A0ABU5T968_9MICC|nr:phospholipid carrier-dependent glycosyltransferase [Sinomonas sp. JGH33]MEA5456190.1 phospholipid carrier-dependent glycosyltransferase [Sinomonas sp. JGH33]